VGALPSDVTDAWLEYLASPAIRHRCSTCSWKGQIVHECPLLGNPKQDAQGIYCLPFIRDDQEYGVLNLYLPEARHIDEQSQQFLREIIDEATLALEGIRFRKRGLATLRDLQIVREQTDLNSLLSSSLASLSESLEADYARLSIANFGAAGENTVVTVGDLPPTAQPLVDGMLDTVTKSGEPVVIGDVSAEGRTFSGLRSLMSVPLQRPGEAASGALLVASGKLKAFNPWQLSMLQIISGQIALVVHNVDAMAELEYQTIMEERARLAREIHDGLAQTLGFLKLKMAQVKSYAENGDQARLIETIEIMYANLSEAYQEVRQAIDGLRMVAYGAGLDGWLRLTAAEFEENTGLVLHINEPIEEASLSPEMIAQLVRIVQEALNNTRKHSHASQVWVSCQEIGSDLILEVRDDGAGFDIEDIPGPSQHGLQGMRERADLIGADFQVISRPRGGTTVRVRLPLALEGYKL